MKKEEKKYYVYVYLDPTKPGTYRYPFKHGAYCFKFKPIYVGAGKDHRYRFFLLNKSRVKNEDLYNEIKQIRERNSWQDPIVKKVKIGLSRNKSFKWEIKLITAIGRLNINTGPLFNKTNGGLGCIGMIQSEESKKKTGKNSKEWWSNPEYRKKMGKIYKKAWENSKSREKMSEINKGEGNPNVKLAKKEVLEIRQLRKEGWSFSNLMKKYKVGRTCVCRIVNRQSWIHI